MCCIHLQSPSPVSRSLTWYLTPVIFTTTYFQKSGSGGYTTPSTCLQSHFQTPSSISLLCAIVSTSSMIPFCTYARIAFLNTSSVTILPTIPSNSSCHASSFYHSLTPFLCHPIVLDCLVFF